VLCGKQIVAHLLHDSMQLLFSSYTKMLDKNDLSHQVERCMLCAGVGGLTG
jgi:hypothetical protein